MLQRQFPEYGDCDAKVKLDNLVRLLQEDIFESQYMDGRAAARLVATALKSYVAGAGLALWNESEVLSKVTEPGQRLNLVCAAIFDLLCNVEYLHGRVTDRKWIYCNRHRTDGHEGQPTAFFSFLKQCPICCQDRGLETRIGGAQHKPSSHHIGEITTTALTLFLSLVGRSGPRPVQVGVVSKQSHDVDAVAWRDDLVVLLEMKASPMVTYPLRVVLDQPITEGTQNGPKEIPQHTLVDVLHRSHELELYLANRGWGLPLGRPSGGAWPYPQVTQFLGTPRNLLRFFEAWLDVFLGYRVPKTQRTGREVVLGYLANGWGDEIDSNKTKAGLGRTDDIKKGTYQLLKYGAYYRSGCPNLNIRGALVANLDPIFMYADYMERLIDARWAPAAKFHPIDATPDKLLVAERDLFYVYDAVLAFNRPVLNDPLVADSFDFNLFEAALQEGRLDDELERWMSL